VGKGPPATALRSARLEFVTCADATGLSRPKYLVEYFDAEPLEDDFRIGLYNIAPTQPVATVRPEH